MMPRFDVCPIALILIFSSSIAWLAHGAFRMCHTYYFACSIFSHGCTTLTFVLSRKLTTCSPHMEVPPLTLLRPTATLQSHLPTNNYLCMYWKNNIYVQHVAIEGLATAGGIQG